jgi:hypothetical protein
LLLPFSGFRIGISKTPAFDLVRPELIGRKARKFPLLVGVVDQAVLLALVLFHSIAPGREKTHYL